MEIVTFSFLAILFGVRHGMDADHIAAIADMVGTENQRKRQVKLGVMYAAGHGLIVFIIGVVAIYLGTQLPHGVLVFLEILVGASLILLGGFILFTILQTKSNYEYKSRLMLVYEFLMKVTRRNHTDDHKLSPLSVGIIGALIIGVIHGLGVETPTQVVVITNAVGLNNLTAAMMQLLLFVVGLLLSTILITFLASWGFMKARYKRTLYFLLGGVTGIYSLGLGIVIIYGV
jgi:high-affinity nickel permease